MTSYFSQGSTDAIIADGLRDGDVVLINRPCLSLGDPISMALCLASKYGLSGEGRQCWDHAAIVVRDRGVPYLLEGNSGGVTMRTYEERLLQSRDHQEVTVLPLRTAAAASSSARQGEDQRRATAFARASSTSSAFAARPMALIRPARRAAATRGPRIARYGSRSPSVASPPPPPPPRRQQRRVARAADLARRLSRPRCSVSARSTRGSIRPR